MGYEFAARVAAYIAFPPAPLTLSVLPFIPRPAIMVRSTVPAPLLADSMLVFALAADAGHTALCGGATRYCPPGLGTGLMPVPIEQGGPIAEPGV